MPSANFSASRRKLLISAPAVATAALLASTGFTPTAQAISLSPAAAASGPVTFYAEMRVVQPFKPAFDSGIQTFAQAMRGHGALAVTLKQMVGDSTMVKNYPAHFKGVLGSAYAEGTEAGTLPFFYSLFVRFDSLQALRAAQADAAFDRNVLPHLHGAMQQGGKMLASPQPMAVYRGVFETMLAGDRNGIYSRRDELLHFLRKPVDDNAPTLITVENHVFVPESSVPVFDKTIPPLLKVAQETCQPEQGAGSAGLPGAADNLHYRKAVSTEILRKVEPDGELRAYIMHGIWESVWDHENSHLDPRFKTAAAPVGAMVAIGPVEPFYTTRLTVLKG